MKYMFIISIIFINYSVVSILKKLSPWNNISLNSTLETQINLRKD